MATEDLTRVLDEAGARYAPFARAHRERRRRGGSAQARAGRRGEDAVLTTPGATCARCCPPRSGSTSTSSPRHRRQVHWEDGRTSIFSPRRASSSRSSGTPRLAFLRLLAADVGDLRFRQAHEIGRLHPHRPLMGTRLEHDRVAFDEPQVEDHPVSLAAERRHGAELELSVVAGEIVLGRQMHLLAARSYELADLAEVDPLR